MKKTKNIIALILIVLLMGALLVVTYFFSKDKISANELIDASKAHQMIFPEADSFMESEYFNDLLKTYLNSVGYTDEDIAVTSILYAKDSDGRVAGILIDVNSYKRNGGLIKTSIGIKIDGAIKDIIILGITDQKGLDVQVDSETFLNQFNDKFVDEFNLVNTNVNDEADILEVTGASEASQCVVTAVNGALKTYTFLDGSEGGFLNY